jgi:hypothetical protein
MLLCGGKQAVNLPDMLNLVDFGICFYLGIVSNHENLTGKVIKIYLDIRY